MRLGSYPCRVKGKTRAYKAYGKQNIHERHRHRFEVNNRYRKKMEQMGLIVSGENLDLNLVEMIELKNHPYFMATQAHPEFRSKPVRPPPHIAGEAEVARGGGQPERGAPQLEPRRQDWGAVRGGVMGGGVMGRPIASRMQCDAVCHRPPAACASEAP